MSVPLASPYFNAVHERIRRASIVWTVALFLFTIVALVIGELMVAAAFASHGALVAAIFLGNVRSNKLLYVPALFMGVSDISYKRIA